MDNSKRALQFATLLLGLTTGGIAEAVDWRDYLGCCLSPDPIRCLGEISESATFKLDEQHKVLTARITKLNNAGLLKEVQKSKSKLGLRSGPYSATCGPRKMLGMFEMLVPLAKIQKVCNIRSVSGPRVPKKMNRAARRAE